MEDPKFLVPGETKEDRDRYSAYWNDIFKEILVNDNYNPLIETLQELHDLTIALTPSRKDLHEKFSEIVDIDFIKQKLVHKVFTSDDFIGLFSFWIDWVKDMGCVEDEEDLIEFKNDLIKIANKEGYLYVLPYAYYELYGQVDETLRILEEIKKKIREINDK